MSWHRFDPKRGLLVLDMQVQPGARASEAVIRADGSLLVRVKAPPVDGRANEALCDFIAQRLGVAKSRVSVRRGAGARRKQLEVRIDRFDAASLVDAG